MVEWTCPYCGGPHEFPEPPAQWWQGEPYNNPAPMPNDDDIAALLVNNGHIHLEGKK